MESKGINTDNVQIVRCGVDDEQFTQRKNFVSGKNFKVGVVGRLVEKKGVDTLIHAVALMKNKGMDVELHIAGSGPLESELIRLAGNTKDISFLGSMAHTDVAEFISSLDAFVLPCKIDRNGDMDGIPVVLMEAMSMGLPIVTTSDGSIEELVDNIIVMPGDIRALVNGLQEVADSLGNKDVIGTHNRNKVSGLHGPKNIDLVDEYFEKLVER